MVCLFTIQIHWYQIVLLGVFERLAQGDTQGGSAAAGIEPAISNGKSNARTIDVQDIYS